MVIGIVLCAGIYAATALNVTGPYTFGQQFHAVCSLRRVSIPSPSRADGEVTVNVHSKDAFQIIAEEATLLHHGSAAEPAAYTVPEEQSMPLFTLLRSLE